MELAKCCRKHLVHMGRQPVLITGPRLYRSQDKPTECPKSYIIFIQLFIYFELLKQPQADLWRGLRHVVPAWFLWPA